MDWQARRDSNPQPPVLETGALPIELLAFLMGLCSQSRPLEGPARRPRTPASYLLRLSMGVYASDTIGQYFLISRRSGRPFVLGRAVVTPLALLARQRNNVAH